MARKRKKAKKRKKKAEAKADAAAAATFVFVEVRLADPARLASGAVEVAALRPPAEGTLDGPSEPERFHEYVRPKDLAAKGALTKAGLERAVAPEDAATALAAFAGDSIVATRNAPAIRAAFPGAVDEEKLLDLAEFARAVRPEMAGFGAADLARLVGEVTTAEAGEEEGASDPSVPDSLAREAETTRRVWEVLREELENLPRAVLAQATWLVPPAGDALGGMLLRAEVEAGEGGGADEKALKELFAERGEELRSARQPRPLGEPATLDEGATERLLEPGGAASRALAGYEDRPQQRRMAGAVARAFSAGRHLLVEGGTGVGKSLAYLFPAVLWARRCNRPVVVATHTKNLQSQLFEKDLPLVARALACETEGKGEFRAALIKGRRNYLCLRKLFYLLGASTWELDPAERAGMLSVLTWAVRTRTGDLGENNALQQFGPWTLFDKLTTTGDECMGKRCSAFGQCFLQAARARSLRADVVVANHALVFAELGLETPVLPDYEEIVFDEAQHVEDVATEHLAVRASRIGVMRILVRLFRARRGGAGTGLLATAFEYLSAAEAKLERDFVAPAREAISSAAEAVRPVSDAADDFFADAADLLAPGGYGGGNTRSSRERQRRYRNSGRDSERWQQVFESGRALEKKLAELADLVRRVVDVLGDPRGKGIRARRELARDLGARSQGLEEAAHNVGFVLAAEADNYVYWVEEDASRSRRGPFAALCAAPVQVADLLRAQLLDQKRSVICTSATLTVAGSFDFLAGRLGFDLSVTGDTLRGSQGGPGAPAGWDTESTCSPQPARCPHVATLEVGSPFDYETQARAFVPRFLPDPRSGGAYVEGLSELLVELFAASGGRGMALFTSYAMLDDVRDAVAPALGSRGVRVLAQGKDGSREAMLATLKSAPRTVLLGTSSFWEGVDVPGEALSVLVVARLPFHVFTEPIIEARCEALRAAGEDAFLAYTLPAAVLRLRQGTGRLIRTKSDRGVVVIADPRIVRTGYGRAFVESLPVRPRVSPTSKALVREAEAFLGAYPHGEERES